MEVEGDWKSQYFTDGKNNGETWKDRAQKKTQVSSFLKEYSKDVLVFW